MSQILLFLGVLTVSTAPPLIRLAQPVPALTIALGRVAIAALVLSALANHKLLDLLRLRRREQFMVLLAGVALGLHFAVWIRSLELTSTAASVTLVATQPLFAGILGWVVLGEGFRRREFGALVVVFSGFVLLAWDDLSSGSSALMGDLLALLGAFLVTVYLLVGRALRAKVSLASFLAASNLVAALLLAVLAFAFAPKAHGFSSVDYLAVLLLALGPSVLGHTLLNACARSMPVHVVCLGIVGEPILGTIATWVFFEEAPTWLVAVGALVVIVGVLTGVLGKQQE